MLIGKFTGLTEKANMLFHKPISQIVIREKFKAVNETPYPQSNVPYARIRLISSKMGSSEEAVPKMQLNHLSEISSKFEGFDTRAGGVLPEGKTDHVLSGEGIYTIQLGAITEGGILSCVDLSNDKYLDLELSGLHKDAEYEIYGIEGYVISPFIRKYSLMYLSRDEKQKNFKKGANELLVLPLVGIDEIQFYPVNSRSFTLTQFELMHDAMKNNDIAIANIAHGGELNIDNNTKGFGLQRNLLMTRDITPDATKGATADTLKVSGSVVDIALGYEDLTIIDLANIVDFDIRRPEAVQDQPYLFYMVDTYNSND